MADFYHRVETAILTADPAVKCRLTDELRQSWNDGCGIGDSGSEIMPIDDPGRPPEPELVDPRQLPRRSFASEEGRIRMLHAFAHIEFNAINIALDAVYRFRQMPASFRSDWLLVASEEARHFQLLQAELLRRGSFYGACLAHRGLWDMVCQTRDNVLHRMALVPRVMEARGLDAGDGGAGPGRYPGDDHQVQAVRRSGRDRYHGGHLPRRGRARAYRQLLVQSAL
jgi:uncharacterized ferritin-like protein (DUF455 family)